MSKKPLTKVQTAALEKGIDSRELAELLHQMVQVDEKADPAKRLAMETSLSSVARIVLSMRDHQADNGKSAGIVAEPTYQRAAMIVAVGRDSGHGLELSPERALAEMRSPSGFTEKLTGHPTSGMDVRTIEKIHALENYLTGLQPDEFKQIIKYAKLGKPGQVSKVPVLRELAKHVAEMETAMVPATKLDPSGETVRASYFGKQRFDAIPVLLLRQDRVHRSFLDNKTKGEKVFDPRFEGEQAKLQPTGRVSLAELDRQERLLECLSWQGDRDSKPNVTAAVIEEAVQYNTKQTHAWYRDELAKLAMALEEKAREKSASSDVESLTAVEKTREAIADIRAIKFDNAAEFRKQLGAIKEKYEGQGFHFPQLKDKNGFSTRYSQLDALYVQVVNAGDCYPKIEMRQNATMHRNALKHVMKIYQMDEHLPDKRLAQEYIRAVDEANGGKEPTLEKINALNTVNMQTNQTFLVQARDDKSFGKLIRKKLDEYEGEVKAFYKNNDAKQQAERLKTDKEFKERLEFYETLKGWELTTKYSDAIKSYVIAETGVMHNEQKIVENIPEETARRTFVANKMRADVMTAMILKYLVTPPEERSKKMTQIIPLLESRETIIAAEVMYNRLYTDPVFKEYVANTHFGEAPKVYDEKLKDYRTMTVAEGKQRLGLKFSEDDKHKTIQGTICAKFAGSDSMRENGLCITPLNSHNQEQVQQFAMQHGYWVETDQGVGGAVHRSNPEAFTVSRATSGQGAANHYYTAEAIANRVEGHQAAQMMLGVGYEMRDADPKKDELFGKLRQIAAAVPGHLGNAMMLPLEDVKLRKKSFAPLYAGAKAHAAMFDDKKYDKFIENASGLDFTKWFNYSARPAARQDREFAASSLRAIGYNLSLFSMGANTTLWKGLGEFMANPETGVCDAESIKNVKELMKESPKIQDMMTRAVFGMALADYDSAWKFQGAKRIAAADGTVTIKNKDGETASLDSIAAGTAVGFGEEAEVLAKMDKEFHTIGKVVLEIYRDLQSNGKAAELKKPFQPKMLLDIMPPEMRAEVADMKKGLDKARAMLVQVRNDPFYEAFKAAGPKQKAMENDPKYRKAENAFRAIAEILESGTHESLNRISRNFNNEFVASALASIEAGKGVADVIKRSQAEFHSAA